MNILSVFDEDLRGQPILENEYHVTKAGIPILLVGFSAASPS
jgi:hypothetical protein